MRTGRIAAYPRRSARSAPLRVPLEGHAQPDGSAPDRARVTSARGRRIRVNSGTHWPGRGGRDRHPVRAPTHRQPGRGRSDGPPRNLPGDLDVEVGQGRGQHGAPRAPRGGGRARRTPRPRGEPAAEVADQSLAAGRQLVQREPAGRLDPVADVAVAVDRHGQHRRVEARLLHPARRACRSPGRRAGPSGYTARWGPAPAPGPARKSGIASGRPSGSGPARSRVATCRGRADRPLDPRRRSGLF